MIKDFVMKRFCLFLVSVLYMGFLYSQCANEENIYSFSFDNKNYEIVKELKTWSAASSCAVERGGYLVEISSLDEQNAVYDAIISGAGIANNYVSISNGGGIAYVWIGATDSNTEGTWLWDGDNNSTGPNFWIGEGGNGDDNGVIIDDSYVNWGGTSTGSQNEPDNYGSGQDNAAIGLAGWPSGTTMLGIPGEWNDIIGTSQLYYVIEYDNTSDLNKDELDDFILFPNPTNSTFTVVLPKFTSEAKFCLFNMQGECIKEMCLSSDSQIDISMLSNGVYFYKVANENNTFSGKLIKL